MIKLVIVVGKEPRVRTFSDADLLIGTGEECDLILNEAGVAEKHCRIERIAFGYKLVDVESHGATMVNDEVVTQKRLKSGDKIGLGPTLIYFQRAPERIEAIIRADHRDQLPPRGPDPEELRRRMNEVLDKYYNVLGDEGLAEADQILQAYLTRRGLGYTNQLLEREERLLRLQNINKALAKERDERRLLSLVLDSAVELTGAERGFLLLNKANRRGLRVEVARNFDQEGIKKPTYKISRSIADEVARTGNALVVADAVQDERFIESMSVADLKLRSVICFPLKTRGEVLGVIYLDNRFQAGTFGDRETRILEMFADQASIALLNARLFGNPASDDRDAETPPTPPPADERTAEMTKLLEQTSIVQERQTKFAYREIIANSPAMIETLGRLDRIIPSEAPVLIRGESGTGKELVARAIHDYGPRKDKPFVSENCAAIPETLLESELFGYKKGAFTGADRNKDGLFQQADGGTLFLDEIGDMPANLQTKMLRALERGEVRPVGSGQTVKVDVRIISATNQDLEKMIQEKTFREDLYYRLNVFAVELPPLRDRWEDIPLLVSHFLEEATPDDAPPRPVSDEAMLAMMLYPWPGNIRELRNEVLRAVTLSGDAIDANDLSETLRPLKRPLKQIVQDVERRVIAQVLARTRWKKSEAARLLGISRPTLDARIEAHGLAAPPD